jgi:hypothetical protein
MYFMLFRLHFSKFKETFIILERYSTARKTAQKQLFLASLIGRKYVLFIKNRAMQVFRTGFRPLRELQAFERIMRNTMRRRVVNRMFRIWRGETNKREYIKIRCLEVETTVGKIAESYRNTLCFSAFNRLKYLGANQLHKRAVMVMESVCRSALLGSQNTFLSSLFSMSNQQQL